MREERVLNLPLPGPVWGAIRVPYPMTEEEWEFMVSIIQAFKVGIVEPALRTREGEHGT